MNVVYLSLGSNQGDRMQWIQKAIVLLNENCGPIIKMSSIYETAAWGLTEQPNFLNMVVELETTKAATELLTEIHHIEHLLGRQREVKWGQRTLDIDILLFNDEIIDLPGLSVPHPYLHQRLFTLKPLAEIAAGFVHPRLNKSIGELLLDTHDDLGVVKYVDNNHDK